MTKEQVTIKDGVITSRPATSQELEADMMRIEKENPGVIDRITVNVLWDALEQIEGDIGKARNTIAEMRSKGAKTAEQKRHLASGIDYKAGLVRAKVLLQEKVLAIDETQLKHMMKKKP